MANSGARTPLHFAAEHGHVDITVWSIFLRCTLMFTTRRSEVDSRRCTGLPFEGILTDVVQKLVEFKAVKAGIAAQDIGLDQMRLEAYFDFCFCKNK